MKDIILIGAGGYAKVIIDSFEKEGKHRVVGLVDDQKSGGSWFGISVYSWKKISDLNVRTGLIAIGNNWVRHQVLQKVHQAFPQFEWVSCIHPSAQISRGAQIGAGSVVFANTSIGPDTSIGEHVIVNTGASVDHDCKIANFASIAPGATLGGNVTIGTFTAVSLGAKIIQSIEVGEHTVVGAGAVAVRNLPSYSVCFGVPAKQISTRTAEEPYF